MTSPSEPESQKSSTVGRRHCFFLVYSGEYEETEQCEQNKEGKIEDGEAGKVPAGVTRAGTTVFAEGNQACQRGDQRSGTADVNAQEQLAIVVGEL